MSDHKDVETDAFHELKKRLKNEMEQDLYEDENMFYRFLKARKFDIGSAEKMLRDHLEWRKKLNIKDILQHQHPEVLTKYLPMIRLGFDKEGHSIRYSPSGNTDWIGLFASCKFEEYVKRATSVFVEDMTAMKQRGVEEGKIEFIVNFEKYPFAQATNKTVICNMICIMDVLEQNFPETIKKIRIINASTYFYTFFSLIKRFLPADVLNKLVVYSDDSWKYELPKIMDPDELPAFLGGNRTDPDGNVMCLTFINHGEIVPEKYFIHRSKRSLATEEDVKKEVLPNASFKELILHVKQPDSYLEWEFETESRDVGFGLFYEDSEGKKTELLPIQRINTDEYSESGLYKCGDVGLYTVIFDNTYSFVRSKTVYYRIKVISPEEGDSQILN